MQKNTCVYVTPKDTKFHLITKSNFVLNSDMTPYKTLFCRVNSKARSTLERLSIHPILNQKHPTLQLIRIVKD